MAYNIYEQTRRQNERIAYLINQAWGAEVAWVEDRDFATSPTGKTIIPVVVSRIVGGLVDGLQTPPFKGCIGRRMAA
jgi:hypothetical protein